MHPIDAKDLSALLLDLELSGQDVRDKVLTKLILRSYPTLSTQNN